MVAHQQGTARNLRQRQSPADRPGRNPPSKLWTGQDHRSAVSPVPSDQFVRRCEIAAVLRGYPLVRGVIGIFVMILA